MQEIADLELLIRSRYPILIVESVEERRIERLLQICAQRLQVPLFTWSVVEGLQRGDGSGTIYDTLEPAKALANLRSISGEAVYFFKDLHRFLDDPVVLRTLRDLATLFDRDRRTVVLAAAGLKLPAELSQHAVAFRLQLPDRSELESLVRATLDDLMRTQDIGVRVDSDQLGKIIDGLAGLTRTEARRVLTRAALHDSALTPEDVVEIAAAKGERLAAEGLLEPIAVDDGPTLAGLDKPAWMACQAPRSLHAGG